MKVVFTKFQEPLHADEEGWMQMSGLIYDPRAMEPKASFDAMATPVNILISFKAWYDPKQPINTVASHDIPPPLTMDAMQDVLIKEWLFIVYSKAGIS